MSWSAVRQFSVAVGLLAACLVGCGGAYDAAVSGLVTLDGTPIPKGTVSFSPQAGGPAGFSMIDASGKYLVHTGREEGLLSGSYIVTVAANDSGAPGRNGGPPALGKSLTPEWYRDPTTSGLNFTVAPGDQEINLELNSTPPVGWKPPRR